jgi:stage II sporulation protein AB (anti-sigma F factor)
MNSTPENARTADPHLEIRCKIDSSMLQLLRDFITAVAKHCQFNDAEIGQIEICVDEACANVMEHAYARGTHQFSKQDIIVEVVFEENELTIRVIDHGKGADPASVHRIERLEQYIQGEQERFRGLGFYLMHKYMDRVDIRSIPGEGTTVEMTKRRLAGD